MSVFYAESHEWVEINGEIGIVGISDHAQGELGDIVYVELPEVGAEVEAGGFLCEVESVKAVSEVYSPVTGTVVEVNEDIENEPEKINASAREAWICKIEIKEEPKGLMSEDAYLKKYS